MSELGLRLTKRRGYGDTRPAKCAILCKMLVVESKTEEKYIFDLIFLIFSSDFDTFLSMKTPKPYEPGTWNLEITFTSLHVSRVTCHVSHVTCHMSREASRWRVYYQQGLTRLVYLQFNLYFICRMLQHEKQIFQALSIYHSEEYVQRQYAALSITFEVG